MRRLAAVALLLAACASTGGDRVMKDPESFHAEMTYRRNGYNLVEHRDRFTGESSVWLVADRSEVTMRGVRDGRGLPVKVHPPFYVAEKDGVVAAWVAWGSDRIDCGARAEPIWFWLAGDLREQTDAKFDFDLGERGGFLNSALAELPDLATMKPGAQIEFRVCGAEFALSPLVSAGVAKFAAEHRKP